MRRAGNSNRALSSAARTRSRLSFTSVSGSPTMLNAGSPPASGPRPRPAGVHAGQRAAADDGERQADRHHVGVERRLRVAGRRTQATGSGDLAAESPDVMRAIDRRSRSTGVMVRRVVGVVRPRQVDDHPKGARRCAVNSMGSPQS